MKRKLTPLVAVAAMIALASTSHAQQSTGIRTLEQSQAAELEPAPFESHYDYLPRPCPPTADCCPPGGYPCGLLPDDANRGWHASLKSWVFKRYAGSYEIRTKLPYPQGYYGNYYFRPWAPGYVRQQPHDFQPGIYERPFYHHVDFYPHEQVPHATLGQPLEISDDEIPLPLNEGE